MIKLEYYNRLPVREEYVQMLRCQLRGGIKLKLQSLIGKTGLTRTQVLCGLQELINRNEVTYDTLGKSKFFYISNPT